MLTNHNPLTSAPKSSISFESEGIREKLANLEQPCYVYVKNNQIGLSHEPNADILPRSMINALSPQQLGDRTFCDFHGLDYAYGAGAMAGGIASEDLVISLGKAGFLASFGAAGLVPQRVEKAIHTIQEALPNGRYAFNLIHSPSEEALERGSVELYLKYGVRTVEASAYLDLTPHIVRYRASGLHLNSQGDIETQNKIIAKISRTEVAQKFLKPAPPKLLKALVEQGQITALQATLAEKVPLADDITVEADSGGHTDNRSLVCLLPSIIALRNEIQQQYQYERSIRVGAAGGISTPESAMGVKVQLLKRGSLFPMRAQKLYDLYQTYEGIDAIPTEVRQTIEKQIFQKPLEAVWQETLAYFQERDPEQIERANNNPKRKMALIFRWYLGLSSRWSTSGQPQRTMDYQIWCGPAMGSFNDWVRGTYLEFSENRQVVDVATHIMRGAAYLYRLQSLKLQGVNLPSPYHFYRPTPL